MQIPARSRDCIIIRNSLLRHLFPLHVNGLSSFHGIAASIKGEKWPEFPKTLFMDTIRDDRGKTASIHVNLKLSYVLGIYD